MTANCVRTGEIGQLFLEAVEADCEHRMLQLLEEHKSVLTNWVVNPETSGQSILHLLCQCGKANAVSLLLQHGGTNVNVAIKDKKGWTPLRHATQHGHVNVMALLVESFHADVTEMDEKDKHTLLHVAAQAGHVPAMQFLLQQQQQTDLVQACDVTGCTPLHLASRNGHDDAVLALLHAGADVNACDDGWQTPLLEAAKMGHGSVLAILVREGAAVRAADLQGQTVAQFICTQGHSHLIDYLVQENYVHLLHTPCGVDNRLPLHHAAHAGHVHVVEKLLEHLDAASVSRADDLGKTAYHHACEHGYISVLECLWKHHGASVAVDRQGHAPLHAAVLNDQLDVVKWLLWQFVNVDQNDNPSGRTPLHIACQRGSLAMVQCLVQEGGADTSRRDRHGNAALHVACAKGHLDIVQWLIQCWMVHYRQDAVNQQGATCLHMAAREGQLETVQWLVQVAKVRVGATDHAGRTALHVAAQRCQIDVLTWLVKHGGADANALDKAGCKARHYLQSTQKTVERVSTTCANMDTKHSSSAFGSSTNTKSPSGTSGHETFPNSLHQKRAVVSA